jgi:hypothetical protein
MGDRSEKRVLVAVGRLRLAKQEGRVDGHRRALRQFLGELLELLGRALSGVCANVVPPASRMA